MDNFTNTKGVEQNAGLPPSLPRPKNGKQEDTGPGKTGLFNRKNDKGEGLFKAPVQSRLPKQGQTLPGPYHAPVPRADAHPAQGQGLCEGVGQKPSGHPAFGIGNG